jgi:hypothetical protein
MMNIKFYSEIPGMAERSPILEASKHLPKWMHDARKALKDNPPPANHTHITKCPGVVNLLTTGFILTTWCDVVLETDPDNLEQFKYKLPNGIPEDGGWIDSHNMEHVMKFIPRTTQEKMPIIKYCTPWHVHMPDDVKLLILPISYSEHDFFETAPGILDTNLNDQLNVQGWWKKHPARIMPKGTPIAHLIPLTSEPYVATISDLVPPESLAEIINSIDKNN